MSRLLAVAIVLAIALAAVLIPEHRPPNAGLPIVKAALGPTPPQQFLPCPLSPRNFPRYSERKNDA
jgi:hypothetical protein